MTRYGLLACAVLAAATPAMADEFITYTLSGVFSGTLTNGNQVTALTNQGFTIALTTSLNNVQNNISNNIFETPTVPSVVFSLTGLGQGTYTDTIHLAGANGSNILSFIDASNNKIQMTANGFVPYDLQSPTNISSINVNTTLTHFVTSFGTIDTSTNTIPNSTFAAVVTPEPGSLMLVGLCLVGLSVMRKPIRQKLGLR